MAGDCRVRLALAKLLWGWEPHPGQKEWLLSDAKRRIAACGRRWGKTEAAAVDAATVAIARPGSVQMIVSPSYDQSRLIFDTVERLMLSSALTRRHCKVTRTPYPRLTFHGSLVMARTADEDGRNLRGHSADRVIVDEAAYVRDSVVLEVISPMLADSDGQLVMISTPFGKNHFYRAFVRGQAGNSARHASFTYPSWANPHISSAYIEEQRGELTPRQFAVEYEAQFLDDQSSVFPWEEIEAAMDRPAEGPSEYVVAGIDWARYSDYTALVAIGVGENGCGVVGMDRFNGMGWTRQVERTVEFLRQHRVNAALADQTSIGDPVLEQLRARLWECGVDAAVEGRVFTNQSKRDLVEHLALRLAQGSISIPRDEHLARELQYFEYELTPSGNVRMNGRSGCHDDLVIALALACWQARSAGAAGSYLTGRGRVAAAGW